ncbi:dihydroxy-acid dehydratase [Irregularibacter muris]|uniref:Dihydroxy-acid dehydratase n=1 Tax=Irregularibacter muris TaxID=1796619 RepID=A0AAE3HIQ3_9FIRM|nr:dihydroxy-acid dehydratase [Irregularibacter muris]MCR1899363.1 dihydroxy-acid dehydratase [Irregularibacter muris]
MKYRSSGNLKGMDKGFARGLFKSMGYTDDELMDRPIIGIANSWNTLVPGHFNLNQVSEFVKKGIYRGGGTAVEFGVIGACDGIANGHEGMKYILPSREVICNSIEIEAQAHKLDALVMLGSCDKIIPGMMMAAARLNIPAIIVNGGPMVGGIEFDGRKSDATSMDEALGMVKSGQLDEEFLGILENTCCPSCGSCAFLGTANTVSCLAEALGMSLTGSALVPATYAERLRIAFKSGVEICRLAKDDLKPRDILTKEAIRNGIKTTMAICGSTNAVLHLSALAYEAELDMNIVEEFEKLSKTTPQIVKVNPAAKWDMEEFYRAGGIPRAMKNLGDLIEGSVMTCTGKTMADNLTQYQYDYPPNDEIIKMPEAPFEKTGGIAVLHGNIAPNSAITKPGAFDKSLHHFLGKAKVFNSEEEANDAILGGKIEHGDVVVIRYEGPKGGPGMREMYKAMKFLYGMGLNKTTALITDGRFSGTNNGCFVGHISPEAAEGGPIAAIEDGDIIEIDIAKGVLNAKVSEEEIKKRLKNVVKPNREIPRGYLQVYAKLASSADKGAVIL